ncbi:hypothetical protein PG988_011323 [Apiospora saccharicola]
MSILLVPPLLKVGPPLRGLLFQNVRVNVRVVLPARFDVDPDLLLDPLVLQSFLQAFVVVPQVLQDLLAEAVRHPPAPRRG